MTEFDAAQLEPKLRRFHDYWLSKHPDGKLPGRQHLDPAEIPDLLPHISLYDVVREESGLPRFRFRLVGTRTAQLMGRDVTGSFIEDVFPPDNAATINQRFRDIVRERQPDFLRASGRIPGREHIHFQRLIVPLAADGAAVDMLASILLPAPAPPNG